MNHLHNVVHLYLYHAENKAGGGVGREVVYSYQVALALATEWLLCASFIKLVKIIYIRKKCGQA